MTSGDSGTGSRSGGQLVVDTLLSEGVSKLFTVAGESFLPVLDALYDQTERIDLVSTRHEEGAGFAAEAYAKTSHQPGVCIVTRGPGAAHLSIALHTARQDSTPLVALIGQVPHEVRHREAFQEVDYLGFFGPLVKWALEIPSAERIPELLQQAFKVARSERPGPVVVSLPEQILYETAERTALPSIRIRAPRPAREEVAAATQLLTEAEAPVLVAGREVLTSGATRALVEFAERFAMPVMTSFRRFDAFPNQHSHYVGNLGLGAPAESLEPIESADVVVALGVRLTQMTTSRYRYPRPGSQLIHVAGAAETLGTWGNPTLAIVADVAAFIEESLQGLEEAEGEVRARADRENRISRFRSRYERASAFEAPPPDGTGSVNISALLGSIKEHAPEGTALVTDAGNFSGWIARYYPFTSPGTHFGPSSGAMGYALPAALGISQAAPNRTVVSLSGDGGFPMTMNELSTLRRENSNVIGIVFVNGVHGTIRMHQQRRYPGRPIATDLCNPSFEAIARAHGIPGSSVTSNGEFESIFREAVDRGGPTLIEVQLGNERLSAWGEP